MFCKINDVILVCCFAGVQKVNSKTVTSVMLGEFKKDARTRDEFFRLVRTSNSREWASVSWKILWFELNNLFVSTFFFHLF